MKVYVQAYFNKNLGDDLFLKIIGERYKSNLYSFSYLKYNNFKSLKIYSNVMIKILDKFIRFITLKRYSFFSIIPFFFKYNVIIGGSLFIEKNECKNIKKNISRKKQNNTYILGVNFGPYKNVQFLDAYRNYFSNVKDICFRDKFSYNLFDSLDNVRLASDIVFSLDVTDVKISSEKAVVFSIINLKERETLKKHLKSYENKIIELINFFAERGYSIKLISFCKNEGDEEVINRIIDKVPNFNIQKYFYDGDIQSALNFIGSSQIIVGTRFHANILGMVMGKTVIPIAYSDKTLNVLHDLNFKGKIFDIRDIDNFDVSSITDYDLKYKIDVSDAIKNAEKHFQELDKVLERK